MYDFNLMDNNKAINNNTNIIFVLFIMNYFIIFLLIHKYNFYENQKINIKNEIKLLNKKYLYYDNCIERLIIISNDTTEQINIIISNIKQNENLLKKQILNIEECLNNEIDLIKKKLIINNDAKINNIAEDKLNNEIKKTNIVKEKEIEKYILLNEKINIIEDKLNNENEKINIIENKLNNNNENNNVIEKKINNQIEKINSSINFLTNEIEKQIKIIPIPNELCHIIDFNCSVIEFTIIDNKWLCLFEYFDYDYDNLYRMGQILPLEHYKLKNIDYKLIDITKLRNIDMQYFFSQFKNIKNIYFNFGNTCNNISDNSQTQILLQNILCLFSKLIDINLFDKNKMIDINLTFKEFNKNERTKIEFINNFTKINYYKSMNLKIKNNLKNSNQSNTSFVTHECFDNLKNHCQLNNIIFSSNIGL